MKKPILFLSLSVLSLTLAAQRITISDTVSTLWKNQMIIVESMHASGKDFIASGSLGAGSMVATAIGSILIATAPVQTTGYGRYGTEPAPNKTIGYAFLGIGMGCLVATFVTLIDGGKKLKKVRN